MFDKKKFTKLKKKDVNVSKSTTLVLMPLTQIKCMINSTAKKIGMKVIAADMVGNCLAYFT